MNGNADFAQNLLRLRHFPEKSFSSYFARGNEGALAHVRAISSSLVKENDRHILVYGPNCCGKTHLLQAACRKKAENKASCAYFPISKNLTTGGKALLGLGSADLIAIDDVHLAGENEDMQLDLLRLIDDARNSGGCMLISSAQSPQSMKNSSAKVILPDLQSRLVWGATYRLREIENSDLRDAVFYFFAWRECSVTEAAVDYILNHSARDTTTIIELVKHLCLLARQQKRRVTSLFARDYMRSQ